MIMDQSFLKKNATVSDFLKQEEWRREEANSQHYIPFRPIIKETWTASDKSFFSLAGFLGKRRPTYKGFQLKLIGPSLESSQVSAAVKVGW